MPLACLRSACLQLFRADRGNRSGASLLAFPTSIQMGDLCRSSRATSLCLPDDRRRFAIPHTPIRVGRHVSSPPLQGQANRKQRRHGFAQGVPGRHPIAQQPVMRPQSNHRRSPADCVHHPIERNSPQPLAPIIGTAGEQQQETDRHSVLRLYVQARRQYLAVRHSNRQVARTKPRTDIEKSSRAP